MTPAVSPSDSRLSLDGYQPPRILSIAGTDPTGGAGIQADIKSISAMGGYAMAVVTALVAQNTRGVLSVHTPPVSFLTEQLDAVSDDVEIDAVKIGMLGTSEITAAVGAWLAGNRQQLVVLDPVMIATSGDRLLSPDAEQALRDLLPHVALVTPNLPELAVLASEPVATGWDEALLQGERVSARYGVTVLVKGGHLDGDSCPDALVDASPETEVARVFQLEGPRYPTANTHGTGCSLSAALATVMARTGSWDVALRESTEWLRDSIRTSGHLHVGEGNGPVNHFNMLWTAAGFGATTDD
ncbi:bifunctional hydroxymethylpyrimidine kinase/phosphomethylpyrimidine kinase [Lysinibacter cavernae]|uniref:Hydroxymethylpyrimidine kinase/phosphomethylpyrimidine kinase n=1 Tax=Lysinibacter cavernae TaxID=1640652 RepID=A0A7X5QZT7_9MICO|nr:bifunctional hydroxymethylpyrimidine kinase/phosphomethylpyrimidine kinase [Lysinibacter cavernae]NIH53055.1 hydroxymethylpyrimidine kinase/phosphomethylpyrimidine kinase [Lysinibacter cavernae]